MKTKVHKYVIEAMSDAADALREHIRFSNDPEDVEALKKLNMAFLMVEAVNE
jgi:hypothetical protein